MWYESNYIIEDHGDHFEIFDIRRNKIIQSVRTYEDALEAVAEDAYKAEFGGFDDSDGEEVLTAYENPTKSKEIG